MAQGGFILAVVFGLIALVNSQCTLTGCSFPNCAGDTDSCTRTTCNTCSAGWYLDPTHKICCQLTTGCVKATCNADQTGVRCTECGTGFFLSNNACTACTKPNGCTASTCDIATGNNVVCTTCENGRTKVGAAGTCCSVPANCKTVSGCTDPATASTSTCTACNDGYFLNAGVCTACTQSDDTNVGSCITGTQSSFTCTSATVTTTKCLACPVTEELSANGRCCDDDDVDVAACDKIAYCDADGVNGECLTCEDGYWKGTTASANGGFDCTLCTPNAALLCDDYVCTTAADTKCADCATPATHSLNSAGKCCVTVPNCDVQGDCTHTGNAGTLCTTCKTGYYRTTDNDATTADTCTLCPASGNGFTCATSTCTAANAVTGCLTCAAGNYRNTTNHCVACSTTACPTGTRQTAACTTTADRVCTPYTVCTATQYEVSPPNGQTDRVCSPCRALCANCAQNDCVSCTQCAAGYVFSDDGDECIVSCGNGVLDTAEGETCDDASEACNDECQCIEGYRPDGEGGCDDVDECVVYGCSFNEVNDDAVVCTQGVNTRTCTCQDGRLVRTLDDTEPTEASQTLEGDAPFNGCTDADLSIEQFIDALGSDGGIAMLQWQFDEWVAGSDVVRVDDHEDDGRKFTVVYTAPAGTDVDEEAVAASLDEFLSNLFLIEASDLTVTPVEAEGENTYAVEGTFSEDALDSASTVFPILSVVSALLVLLR